MAEKTDERDVQVGYQYEPLVYLVTPELNQQYLYAEEDFHPRYIQDTEGGSPIVHPALILNMSNSTRSPSYYLPPGVSSLHTRDEAFFYNPARVGKKLTVTWKVVDTYQKRGRLYRVIECWVTDEDGVKIMKRLLHSTFTVREH